MSDTVYQLGELCDFQRGLTYEKAHEVEVSGNVVLRATNISLKSNLLDLSELRYISDSVTVPAPKRVKQYSLLVCTASGSKSHLGKVAYIDQNYGFAFGGFMGLLTPKACIHPRYLFHRLTSPDYKAFIDELADGTNINNLKFEDLARFPVPLPSIGEQQRIVAILDEAFAAIAIATERTREARQQSQFLLASELDRYWKSTDGDEDRRTESLGSRIKFIDYRGKTPVKTTSGLRLITAKNVKMGYIQEHPLEYISRDSYDSWMTRGIPQPGDVLFTTEAPLANVAQLDTDDPVVFAQRIIIMQPDRAAINPTFLKYLLLSPRYQAAIREQGTGATVQGIKASLLRKIPITYPTSLIKQEKAVERFNALSSQAAELDSIAHKKLTTLESLKKSLLHHAFTGQLTAKKADEVLAAL